MLTVSLCYVLAVRVASVLRAMDILDEIEGAITDDAGQTENFNQHATHHNAYPPFQHTQPFHPGRTFVGIRPNHQQQDFLGHEQTPVVGHHFGSSSSYSQGELPRSPIGLMIQVSDPLYPFPYVQSIRLVQPTAQEEMIVTLLQLMPFRLLTRRNLSSIVQLPVRPNRSPIHTSGQLTEFHEPIDSIQKSQTARRPSIAISPASCTCLSSTTPTCSSYPQ